MPRDRCMTERPRWAKVSDTQLLLERETRRHDLTEHGGDGVVGKRSAVVRLDRAQHLRLPLRTVRRRPGLERADFLRMCGALIQQAQQLAIESVDRLAPPVQFLLAVVG